MAKLSDLNEDIIIAVLLSCDVFTIMKVEQTCMYLKSVSSSRTLWLALVQDLDHDHAPALLPHESLQSLPAERLRELAVRATKGYLNWTSSNGAKASHTSAIELLEAQDHGITLGMLAPGGKYFVFQAGNGCFHCYDTEKQVNICSHQGASPNDERIQYMDCLSDDGEASLILAYLTFQESSEQEQQNVTVVRFDLNARTSSIVGSFLCSVEESDEDRPTSFSSCFNKTCRIKVNNNVVAAVIYNSIFVANWRTGKGVVTEELGNISGLNISQNHVLCVIIEYADLEKERVLLAAAPLSLIFATENVSSIRLNATASGESTLPVPIRSKDVFIHVSPLAYPRVLQGKLVCPNVGPTSFCSDIWKYPSLCESNALAVSTRILILLCLETKRGSYYMLFHFEFSTTTMDSIHSISQSTDNGSAISRDYTLTLHQQSPLYSDDDAECLFYLSSAMRTGRCVGSFGEYESPTTVCTIDMHSLVQGLCSSNKEDSDSDSGSEYEVPQYKKISEDIFTGCNEATLMNLNVEEYSGALWYLRGTSVFIHHFD